MPHLSRSRRSTSNPSVFERFAGEVVGREADGHRLEQPLDRAHGADGAADVLEQQQLPARAQHAPRLCDRAAWVGDRAEAERA
jgi:hypothetical protein